MDNEPGSTPPPTHTPTPAQADRRDSEAIHEATRTSDLRRRCGAPVITMINTFTPPSIFHWHSAPSRCVEYVTDQILSFPENTRLFLIK